MFNITESTIEWEGKALTLKTGHIGRQASAVCASYGETVILAAVTTKRIEEGDTSQEGFSGLCLITNFLAKSYATGKIPNGFTKREGKLSEREVLASRIVDRAIRPLIDQNLVNEVNIVCKLLAHDGKTMPEVPALVAASAALKISGAPFKSPVVGLAFDLDKEGNHHINKSAEEPDLSLFVACTNDSVVMVEADAKEASEDTVCDAFDHLLESAKPVVKFVEDFAGSVDSTSQNSFLFNKDEENTEVIKKGFAEEIKSIYNQEIKSKEARHTKLRELHRKIYSDLEPKGLYRSDIKRCIKKVENSVARSKIIEEEKRIDGRAPSDIREIHIDLDYLRGTHGSAVFTRGGTQSLAVVTLGSHHDEQIVDDLDGERRESVLLHYNFLPYAVGEVGPLRAPGRRETGHGRLALKAIKNILPSKKDFPYTVRIVSEITESDGSSSMATVCGASLALMETGVPIKKHIAGVAMGLVHTKEKYVVLTDISGDEDSLGDMDFKVAGTEDGITALQMDIKTDGISMDVIKDALSEALKARLHILKKMQESIGEHRKSLKDSAPKMLSYEIPAESVPKVIGSGGKTIRSLCEENSCKIDIDAKNFVHIVADTYENLLSVQSRINSISGAMSPKPGETYKGKVVGVADFGFFVSLPTGYDGLVHISEIQKGRVEDIYAMHEEGDEITVRVKEIARDSKIRLTMRLDEDERIGRDQDETDRFSQRRQPSGLSHKRPAKRPASSDRRSTLPGPKQRQRFF